MRPPAFVLAVLLCAGCVTRSSPPASEPPPPDPAAGATVGPVASGSAAPAVHALAPDAPPAAQSLSRAEPTRPSASTAKAAASTIDFDAQVKPILAARCQPCHFPGGVMHGKLPFDRAETINLLGVKLFTRIKDPQRQATIRAFLDQSARP